MKIPFLAALFLAIGQFAWSASTVDQEFSRDYDCVLFGIGIVDSDYYIEDPIVVIAPTKSGAFVTYRGSGKKLSKSISKSELNDLITRLSQIYSGATVPSTATDRPIPRFLLLLSINRGSTNISFSKETTPTNKREDLDSLMKLIKGIFPDA